MNNLGKAKKITKTKRQNKDISFESFISHPAVRSIFGKKQKKGKDGKKENKNTQFYESLILDTKPTTEKDEPEVVADTEFYTTPNLKQVMNDPFFPQDSMGYVGETLLQFKKTLLEVPPGEMRGVFFHNTLDDIMLEEDAKAKELGEELELSCKKGCAHCCHKLVYVTPDEGAVLARNLMALEGGEISDLTMANLKFQSQFQPHQQLDFWMLDDKKSKCVFLAGDNSCRIYNNRPSNCRLLRVKSPAYHCSKQATRRGQDEIDQNLSLVGEMLVSAAYDLALTEKRPVLSIPQAILMGIETVKAEDTDQIIDSVNKGYDDEEELLRQQQMNEDLIEENKKNNNRE